METSGCFKQKLIKESGDARFLIVLNKNLYLLIYSKMCRLSFFNHGTLLGMTCF